MSDLSVATDPCARDSHSNGRRTQFVCSMRMQSAREQTNQENEQKKKHEAKTLRLSIQALTVAFLLTLFISKEITTDSNT